MDTRSQYDIKNSIQLKHKMNFTTLTAAETGGNTKHF